MLILFITKLALYQKFYRDFINSITQTTHDIVAHINLQNLILLKKRHRGQLEIADIKEQFELVSGEISHRICLLMSKFTNSEIHVCIIPLYSHGNKTGKILTKDTNYSNIDNPRLQTLCSSANIQLQDRCIEGFGKIEENSDILSIVRDKHCHFFTNNITEKVKNYKKAGQVFKKKNIDKFKSRIVVPIVQRLGDRSEEDGKDLKEILGFICLASDKKNAFKKFDKENYLNILKFFASALYPFFERIYTYLNYLKKIKRFDVIHAQVCISPYHHSSNKT